MYNEPLYFFFKIPMYKNRKLYVATKMKKTPEK